MTSTSFLPGVPLEVTPALLDELVATFMCETPVMRLDDPGAFPPHPVLGRMLRVERRGTELWGEVRWIDGEPLAVAAFGLAIAFQMRRRDPRTGEPLAAKILSAFPASSPRPGYPTTEPAQAEEQKR